MPQQHFIDQFKAQCLTSPLLADKPLLFTKGQTVFHPDLGICTVDAAEGASRRLITYRRIGYSNPEEMTDSVWVDVSVLQDMDLYAQMELLSLSAEDLDVGQDALRT